MSPSRAQGMASAQAARHLTHVAAMLAELLRSERLRRAWTLRELAGRAGLSVAAVHHAESGEPAGLDTYCRIAAALDLRPEFAFVDARARRRGRNTGSEDPVHAAMGELEVARLVAFNHDVRVDEPYQHFQFAGRADVVAIDRARRALLHLENRTRFPNIGEAAGSFNQKREYLASRLAERIGIEGFRSETHAMVVLWSAEALHSIRLRIETFRALCPDPIEVFSAWWDGQPPPPGRHRTIVVLDPAADIGRRRRFIDIQTARTADPRYRGYADAARRLASR